MINDDPAAPQEKYRCTKCECLWRKNPDESWSLYDAQQKACVACDNSPDFLNIIVPFDPEDDRMRQSVDGFLEVYCDAYGDKKGYHSLKGATPTPAAAGEPETLSDFVHAPESVRENIGNKVVEAAINMQRKVSYRKPAREVFPDHLVVSAIDFDALQREAGELREQHDKLKKRYERLDAIHELTFARMEADTPLIDCLQQRAETAERTLAERDAELAAARAMLRRVLDTRDMEAKAILSANVAIENFSDPSAEMDAQCKAMVAASEAEEEAREFLDKQAAILAARWE